MKKILFIACITLLSCNHYLQPDKNQMTLLDKTYSDAISIYGGTDHSYAIADEKYQVVSDELDLILIGDQKRTNAKTLVQMDMILIKGFNVRRTFHKNATTLDTKQLSVERSYMQAYFNPRIRAEKSIK